MVGESFILMPFLQELSITMKKLTIFLITYISLLCKPRPTLVKPNFCVWKTLSEKPKIHGDLAVLFGKIWTNEMVVNTPANRYPPIYQCMEIRQQSMVYDRAAGY